MNEENMFAVNNNFFEKYNPTIRSIVTNILKPANQSQDIDDCVNTVFLSSCVMLYRGISTISTKKHADSLFAAHSSICEWGR